MAIVEIEGKKYFDNELKSLIQEHEHAKVMFALSDVNLNDAVDSSSITLLHLSVEYKNVFLTKFLIQRGCAIDPMDENGETPLIMALKYKRMEQVELLLAANANFHVTDFSGKSALTMIFELRHRGKELEIIKFVLTKLTVMYSNEEGIARTLVDAGCSLDKVVYFNNPSLMMKMLEYGYEVNTKHRNNSNNTALHVAAMLNYLETIKVLLQYGADVTVANKHGHIPLIHGIARQSKQDPAVIEALMPSNFDWIESSRIENDIADRLPLYYIFTKGTKETLEIFQKRYSVDLSATDLHGETPLHYLMTNKNEGILEPFCDAKFDVNAQDCRIKTSALHLAASSGAPDSVKFLLDRGAEVDSKDLLGQTPLLHVFNGITNHEIIESASPKVKNFAKCVELLVVHGADPEVVQEHSSETVLDWVMYNKIYCLIKPVLAHLALLGISGKLMKQQTHDQIYSFNQLKSYYEFCMQQLEKTKTQFLYGRVTVYKILTENEEKIALYARRQETTDELVTTEFQLESYYKKLLEKRLTDAAKINNLRKNVAMLLSEITGLSDPSHLVIDKIVCLLNKFDLQGWLS